MNMSLLYLKKQLIHFFLTVLGLRCAARGLSLIPEGEAYSLAVGHGFSLRWLLLLWSLGSRCMGF